MSIAHTVAEVLEEHVVLEVEGIDRMYLNVYVPQLQRELGVASFLRFHRGFKFASSALMQPMTERFVTRIEQFAQEQGVSVVWLRESDGGLGQRRRGSVCAPARIRAGCPAASKRVGIPTGVSDDVLLQPDGLNVVFGQRNYRFDYAVAEDLHISPLLDVCIPI
jgi:hypothetical protein